MPTDPFLQILSAFHPFEKDLHHPPSPIELRHGLTIDEIASRIGEDHDPVAHLDLVAPWSLALLAQLLAQVMP